MNQEQKQRAAQLLAEWKQGHGTPLGAMTEGRMAALLQELVNAPEPEPFGYFKSEPFGWTDCAETDDGAIALFAAPPAPSVPDNVARDAARYRWLLKQAWFQQAAYRFDLPDGGLQKLFEKCMDEFIDAAMSEKGQQT